MALTSHARTVKSGTRSARGSPTPTEFAKILLSLPVAALPTKLGSSGSLRGSLKDILGPRSARGWSFTSNSLANLLTPRGRTCRDPDRGPSHLRGLLFPTCNALLAGHFPVVVSVPWCDRSGRQGARHAHTETSTDRHGTAHFDPLREETSVLRTVRSENTDRSSFLHRKTSTPSYPFFRRCSKINDEETQNFCRNNFTYVVGPVPPF